MVYARVAHLAFPELAGFRPPLSNLVRFDASACKSF